MAKKKVRKQKSTVAQNYTRHGADLGLPQAMVDAFMALYNARKLPQAQQAAQHLVERYPQSAFSWKALGTSYLEAENPSEALNPLLKSVEIDSNDFLALTSLAAAFYQTGNSEQAIKYQKHAVNLQEKYAPARYRLAEMLKESGLHKEALMHAEEAKVLGIDSLRVEVLIGTIKYQLREFSESLLIFERLEKEYPENFVIYNNLGNINKDLGRHKKAEAYYEKSLAVQPDNWMAYSNLFFAKHYNVNSTTSEILELGRSWEQKFSLPRLGLHKNSKEPLKKLSIGLVSSGFRLHPVGQMIASALENSRSDIDFYAYTTNDNNDFVTEQIKKSCKQWSAIRSLTQKQIAQKIYDDNIDILIDLSGHGDGSCLQAISMRPAPLCVKWVGGLVNTMGLESIDYLLSDHIETPQGVDSQYTEKLIRLPDDYICYMPCAYAPPTSSLPAVKNNFITLGCLNNPAKISGQLLNEWARLMHQIPDSRLLLRGGQYESEDFCCWLWDEMASHDIERNRVILEGPTDHKNFIGTYQRIDIALDTWPYSGGLTTCEALLMGVPVVTLPGPTFAGRHSATHLINAGLPELVTNSWDEYRQRVVELANDLPNLAVIRAGLRTILHYSPVCDAPRFANHFNNALRAIWVRYCDGKAPEALTFNKEGEMWFADEDKLVEIPEVLSEELAEDKPFEWKFDEPIIIVDNAAVMPRHPDYPKWMASGHLAVISFDPSSLLNKKIDELKEYGELHHYPHALLGDGQPATLYATLDAEKGSTLKPLPEDQQPECQREKLKVLAELPISTVALDSIEALPNVDMLVLDDLHDAMTVLRNGEQTLKGVLLIQVKVAFQPTHESQPNLAMLQHWASRNRFNFFRLENMEYKGLELHSADAIFVANEINTRKNKFNWVLANLYRKFDKKNIADLDVLAGNGVQSKMYHYKDGDEHFFINHQKGEMKKLLIVCSRGETFIKPIAEIFNKKLDVEYWHLDYKLPDMKRLQTLMDWSDVTWFEWCDEVVVKASNEIQKNCKVVCRLHGFEAFSQWPNKIKSEFLDQLIFVSEHTLEYVKSRGVNIPSTVIHNGVDIERFKYEERAPGFSLAFVASLKTVKNPQLLVQVVDKLVKIDKRYTVHVAGEISDPILYRYIKHMLESLHIKENVVFYGHVENIDAWLEDKNYLISTSISESFGFNIAEAMVKGIKPLIHNWPGAQKLYPQSLVFNTVEDAVDMILSGDYRSNEYKDYIKRKYALSKQISEIEKCLVEGKGLEVKSSSEDICHFVYNGEDVNFYLPNKNDHIQKMIIRTGTFYEVSMLEDMLDRFKKGSVIIDIGANIGNHTVFFSKFLNACHVIAFEPNIDTFNILAENIKINGVDEKVDAFNLGVADSDGKASVIFYDPNNIGMTKIGMSEEGEINVVKLDNFLKKNERKSVGMIKLDVEGMELDVLKGCKKLLNDSAPLLYVEAGSESDFNAVSEYLEGFGYKAVKRFNATPTYLFEVL
ncbi:hypothetical protein NYA30BAC_03667 [Halomonas sp. NYA30]